MTNLKALLMEVETEKQAEIEWLRGKEKASELLLKFSKQEASELRTELGKARLVMEYWYYLYNHSQLKPGHALDEAVSGTREALRSIDESGVLK